MVKVYQFCTEGVMFCSTLKCKDPPYNSRKFSTDEINITLQFVRSP